MSIQFDELIDLIYQIPKGEKVLRCSHCRRPIKIMTDGKKKWLYCRHCEEMQKEYDEGLWPK